MGIFKNPIFQSFRHSRILNSILSKPIERWVERRKEGIGYIFVGNVLGFDCQEDYVMALVVFCVFELVAK